MKLRVPVIVKDPEVAQWKEVRPTENFTIEGEDFFLDGPVSRRVAIVDFDPQTGRLAPGARFKPPAAGKDYATYELPNGVDFNDPAFGQVATFAGVFKTVCMFEEPDTLGRRIDWAFDGQQLLVVPRAGEWANAFYERDSQSIQLFYWTAPDGSKRIYTSHSQDIIAHETAHAIIDGIAPDLYHATSPQALAIHEAIADLATLIMALRSRQLVVSVLRDTGDSMDYSSAFTGVAEQFARARDFATAARGAGHPLRELRNSLTIRDVDPSAPHALSEVLSGALYAVLVRIYNELRQASTAGARPVAVPAEYAQSEKIEEDIGRASGGPPAGSSGRSLFIAGERFKRTVLRALDYLPPGEVSFVDFARALIASDQASHPDSAAQREWLIDEFITRGIATSAEELAVRTNYENDAVAALDLDELMRSDWLAYQFASANRALLNIPENVPFEVRPRLDVTKKYYHQGKPPSFVRECLLKVSWSETEPSIKAAGLPAKRRISRGTTLAIDWEKRTVRAIVTGLQADWMGRARDRFLTRLIDEDVLRIGEEACGPDGKPVPGVVRGDIVGGVLRLRATACALHMSGVDRG